MPRSSVPLLLASSLAGLACTVGTGGAGGGFGSSFGTGAAPGSESGADGDESSDSGGPAGSDGEAPEAPEGGREFVEEAKKEFPTYLELHEKVITRTCTPNANVCHNNKEYPDLRTPQAMLGMLGSPCNLDVEDPLDTYNGCEPEADVLRFTSGGNAGWETGIAYVDFETDPMGVVTAAVVHLAEPVPAGMLDPMTAESVDVLRTTDAAMLTVGQVNDSVTYVAGSSRVRIDDYAAQGDAVHTLLEADLRGGDPNRDGEFGAEHERLFELKAGDPWGSYLLQRLQGNVPGSPMPLANQPLTAAEVVAVACWIEGAGAPGGDSPYADIEYDDCRYAAEFGEPDPDSGATFSGHVLPILETRCATPGCHGAVAPQADLDLTADVARENLLRTSTQNPEIPLVTPGNPTNSYLWTKLNGDGFSGEQMPPGGSTLSDEELDVVRLWISYGAPDD